RLLLIFFRFLLSKCFCGSLYVSQRLLRLLLGKLLPPKECCTVSIGVRCKSAGALNNIGNTPVTRRKRIFTGIFYFSHYKNLFLCFVVGQGTNINMIKGL